MKFQEFGTFEFLGIDLGFVCGMFFFLNKVKFWALKIYGTWIRAKEDFRRVDDFVRGMIFSF